MCFAPVVLAAQEANVAFGTIKADPGLPVEVTAETLDVNQEDGTALFRGDVRVGQGEMRLNARQVLVIYNSDNSGIERLEATGDVLLVSGPDAAQAERADYTIGSGVIVMTGDVLLTQGANALTSNKMTVNLQTGTAQMVGRVKTILIPDGDD
ncbi:lipopolysaccharide export system protein LptA [Cribrihabitans marinus]|uniref:Lipopolysaccharide export system protein LptA n=1 Tax=Cribrihabitans marinus TaxID=1227549 RepID=A0A1H6Y5Q5_9RHOB|nr:LptA/OstA family protein [Cribrihabitans marinus]SEJ36609.1 lipopolysaccharide export system protein LptA [Cribrihabitans marinus]